MDKNVSLAFVVILRLKFCFLKQIEKFYDTKTVEQNVFVFLQKIVRSFFCLFFLPAANRTFMFRTEKQKKILFWPNWANIDTIWLLSFSILQPLIFYLLLLFLS